MIKNLSIKFKMITLITPLLIFIGMVGWVGMKSMKNANDALSTIYHDRVECLDQIMKIRDGYSILMMGMTRKLVNKTVTYDEALKSYEKGQELIDAQWTAYLSTYLVPEEAVIAEKLKKKMKASSSSLNSLHEYIKDKDYSRISKFAERELAETVDPIIVDLSELAELQVRVSQEIFNEHVSVAESDRNFIIAVIILAYLIGISLAFKIILMITEPLKTANDAIKKMADGNLNVNITDEGSKDEIGEIIRSTAAIARTLKNVERDLREQIDAVREGSLSTRADAKQHTGSFSEIISGVNQLMDTLTAPMSEIASVMAKLASGDIRGRITGEYAGELRALKGNVNRSLEALVALLEAIGTFSANLAKGDLTYKVDGNFQGEFAAIKQNLNAAVDQMTGVLRNVIDTTQQVTISANQTSSSSKGVLEHTHNQTINLSEVTSAIEQTVAAITEIMRSTEQGSALAQNAAVAAENGETTLLSLSETVHSIADRNKRISQISELIGDIADKTYVLALNAGLEAARAGNEGTGFGLIASKITTLAEEVAEATRSIKALIGEATESVEAGVQGASVAKQSIHQIVELSRQNGVTVQGIATSVEQQNAMMHTLKERVLDLKTIGQTTAQAAEEISQTMQSLVHISQDLKKETDRIKIA